MSSEDTNELKKKKSVKKKYYENKYKTNFTINQQG